MNSIVDKNKKNQPKGLVSTKRMVQFISCVVLRLKQKSSFDPFFFSD